MAMNRKTGTVLFTLGGLIIGFALAWFLKPTPQNFATRAGKPCTSGGKTGVYGADGVTCNA